jgi:tricorn protease-like protein
MGAFMLIHDQTDAACRKEANTMKKFSVLGTGILILALLIQGTSPAWAATLPEGNDGAGLAEMAMGQGRSAPKAGVTTRVSVASNGAQANDFSSGPSISATGRYVALESDASNLVSGDTNAVPDVFVHDRKTGQTTRVSVASDGAQGNSNSANPAISATGRYVAFESFANNLVSGDSNDLTDVFVHDRATGQITLVSVASDGTQGNDASLHAAISANGRYVAFFSFASNLVSGDTNAVPDVFVHDRKTGQTTRVSVATGGTQGNNDSLHPSISGNGRYVTFFSSANNLVNGDTNDTGDIFIHDRETGQTSRVSVASDGSQGNGDSEFPSISGTGRYVAFFSVASNLVSGDTNFASDIFVHDRQTGKTTRVSVASDGAQANDGVGIPSISATGRYVAFESFASNLVGGDTNNSQDIFVHDRQTGKTTRVSVATGGTQGNGDSFIIDTSSISVNGRFVAFFSSASNLVSGDTNNSQDIFVHDRQGGGSVDESLPAEMELEAGDD